MVSTPNNTCVTLDFEVEEHVNTVDVPGMDGEGVEEDGGDNVAEITDEFCQDESEHERTVLAAMSEERTTLGEERTTQGTTRKRISEVFLDQHQQTNTSSIDSIASIDSIDQHQQTFSIPLRLVFISGKGVPKMKDAKKLKQKTKKRRW